MSEAKREAWRCSYTGASGAEVGVQWYEEEKQRDAYLEVMPIKGNPVAARYVPEASAQGEAERERDQWRALGEMYVFACDRGLLDTKAARDQFAALLGIGPGGIRSKAGG